jgi:hypothetical protein
LAVAEFLRALEHQMLEEMRHAVLADGAVGRTRLVD